mgnify:CR=1 FL=1
MFARQRGLAASLTACLWVLLFALGLAADQVDLAKMRREEQKRRERAAKSVLILTDQGVVYRDAEAAARAKGKVTLLPGATAGLAEGASAEKAGGSDGEDWLSKRNAERQVWQERISTARDALNQAQSRVEELQSELNRLNTQMLVMDLPMQRKALTDALEARRQEMEKARGDLEKCRQEYESIPEEARRKGVPPGWLR